MLWAGWRARRDERGGWGWSSERCGGFGEGCQTGRDMNCVFGGSGFRALIRVGESNACSKRGCHLWNWDHWESWLWRWWHWFCFCENE
jgi:hypothetical protein